MVKERFFQETVTNNEDKEVLVGDVLLYEINNLDEVGLDSEDCHLFRSGRHKNDMPSVCTFGKFDDAMKDCIGSVNESGDGKSEVSGNIIVSDHLTIIGNNNKALVIAFLSGDNQLLKTIIDVDALGNFISLKTYVEYNCIFKPHETRITEELMVAETDDISGAIEAWSLKRTEGRLVLNKKRPAVFCTWYYYELNVTYEDVKVNLTKIKEKKLPFDVFQIDEGWEITLGEWAPNHKFPKPMKEVADEIKEAGLTPGIWTSPFVAHEAAGIWKEHPEWILTDREGKPVLFPMNNTVYYIVDISIEETWEYFEKLYHKLTYEWGYIYHKLDFTRAPVTAENACFKNPYMTVVECYKNAVKAIRRGMGDEAYFLMCGGLYDPIIGIVDAQRTGSDVLSMWSSTIQKNGKTAPFTIKQSLLRYYMNNWWHNDPDALMIRKNEVMERNSRLTYGLLNDEEVKTSTLNQLIGGGIVCSTEPLDKIDEERLSNLYHILPIRPVKTEVADLLNINRYPDRVRLKEAGNNDAAYLVIINWDDENDLIPQINAEDIAGYNLILDDNKEYCIVDFYGRTTVNNVKRHEGVTLPAIKPHGGTILKITEQRYYKEPDYCGHFLM